MKQVQIRHTTKGSEKYNVVLGKGLMDDQGENFYVFDFFTERGMYHLPLTSIDLNSKAIEETPCLTNMELGFLVEFANCVTNLKYDNRKKDDFEYAGKQLVKNDANLTLLELVDCYKVLVDSKEDYLDAVTRIEELTVKLEELQKNFSTYISNPPEVEPEFNLLDLILKETAAILEDDQIKLAFKGHASLVDLAGLLSYNSELYYVCKLFNLDVDIKGSIRGVEFTLLFNYKIEEPLTTTVAKDLIKELNELTVFLTNLYNDYKVTSTLESGVN